MAVRTKDEILETLRTRIGDDNSDEALALLEDIADTYEDLTTKAASYEELQSQYNELDASWREKYKARFFETGNGLVTPDPIPDIDEPEPEDEEIVTFDGLFTEVK